MKQYIFYKTTFTKDGRFYYGSHYGYLEDSYRGSNKVIRSIYKKHGIEFLHRENLRFFDNKEDMYLFESRFLSLYKLDKNTKCLNFTTNGYGGDTWSQMTDSDKQRRKEILSKKLSGPGNGNYNRKFTDEHIKKMSESKKGKPIHTEEYRERLSERLKNEYKKGLRDNNFLLKFSSNRKGSIQSEETKKSISEGLKNSSRYKEGRKKYAETKRENFLKRLDEFRKLFNNGHSRIDIMKQMNQKISTYLKYEKIIKNERK